MSRWAVRWRPARASVHRGRRAVSRRPFGAQLPASGRRAAGLDLVDVTYSGATTANVLTDFQHGAPPQVDALDGSETLVTVTIGGNDVGYVPMLMAAGLPRITRSVPLLGALLRELLDPAARDRALVEVAESLKEVGRTVRQRAPQARVLFVDYLTLLPPAGTPAPPLSDVDVALGRRVADTLERLTGEAAAETGCEVGARRAGQPRAPRLVSRPLDDEIRFAVAGPTGAVASQCGRDARRRRPGRRAGDLKSWANDRAGWPDQSVRPDPRRRRPDLLDRTRNGDRIPGTQRRRQDHHDADDPRAGPPDVGHRHHRRPDLSPAAQPAAHCRGVAGRQADAPEPVGAQPPALDRGDPPDSGQAGRRGARHGRAHHRRRQERRHALAGHEPAARHRHRAAR